jgi:hypothetical protein
MIVTITKPIPVNPLYYVRCFTLTFAHIEQHFVEIMTRVDILQLHCSKPKQVSALF